MLGLQKEDKIKTAKDNMLNEGAPITDAAKDEADNFASSMKDGMKDAAKCASKKARNFADHTEENLVKTRKTMMQQARDNPVRTGMMALGLGLFVSMLFRRRRA